MHGVDPRGATVVLGRRGWAQAVVPQRSSEDRSAVALCLHLRHPPFSRRMVCFLSDVAQAINFKDFLCKKELDVFLDTSAHCAIRHDHVSKWSLGGFLLSNLNS